MSKASFEAYLDIVNRAVRENVDRQPYRTLAGPVRRLLEGRRIGVKIYKDDRSSPHDFYTVHLVKGELRILEHGKEDPDFTIPIREAHLHTVNADPDRYTRSPLALDLDWLRKYLGIGRMEPERA